MSDEVFGYFGKVQIGNMEFKALDFPRISNPFVTARFKLPQAVKDEILSLKPDFGYGQFSEVVFYRTYSRVKADGTMETWNDVVIRVVEGVLSIRLDWYKKTGIHWDEDFWKTYARGFALSMFHMHWLPPGRGLWAMGTDFIYERGSMALNNCGFSSVGDDIGPSVAWIMDALMCGVGVGFEPVRNDDFEVHYPRGTFKYTIPDTREGWCESVKLLIDAYVNGGVRPVFNYDRVRPSGLPIKGFGGISSGPEPLMKLHKRIEQYFDMYIEHDWYDTVLLKADIVNAVGCCVVAGNVRRSAEICLGGINDQTFLNLKNYEKYPHRAEIGWMSNNSAVLDVNEDYEKLGEVAKRVTRNGEPGIWNRQNVKYGRIGKWKDNVKEDKATGGNPCHKGTNLVYTKDGVCQIQNLVRGTEIWSESGWVEVLNIWTNGIKPVRRYFTDFSSIDLTEDHVIIQNNIKIQIKDATSIDSFPAPGSKLDRVTSSILEVEDIGEHLVYDLSVDNASNTFWCNGYNVSNCGEQPLEDKELCTLVETLPTRCETANQWLKACEYATLYASTVTLLPTHRPETNAVMLRNRRIGVGIIDFSGWKHTIGLNQVIKLLRQGYQRVRSVNHWCQSEAGVPDSIRVTTVKPGGTVPKIAGRTAGLGHPNFHETLRRMRIAMDSPMVPLLIEAGIPYEPDVFSDNTYVFEFPIIQGPAKPASEVSMWEQLVNLVTMQREWSDNAVSNTITFIPEWELEKSVSLDSLESLNLKELTTKDIRTKVEFGKLNIYVRNEHHEENDIEHALAAHASSIKSLSLLPASTRGCYAQMPEEGLSVDQYKKRLAEIKPIDWSRLRHAVAEPEKYCTGESCEIVPRT